MTRLKTDLKSIWIQTASGLAFHPYAPTADQICIEDIAHALGMICRFGGHCRRFYSVAEHSVWVSNLVPPTDALAGLLHDAAEVYLCDLPTPIKDELKGYSRLEFLVTEAIQRKWGLDTGPWPETVQNADLTLLATEKAQLTAPEPRPWQRLPAPLDIELKCLAPEDAKHAFLRRFRELQK
jgi:hypothetical protein